MQYGAIPTSLAERLALFAGAVPIPVLDTLFAMMKARIVMAAVRLGVFEGLAVEGRTASALADTLQLDEECLEMLLRSLVYCGYLEVTARRYELSSLGRRSMVSGAPKELTGFVRWNYTQWDWAGHLESLVTTGRGVDFHSTLTDAAAWADYQQAMLELARFDAPVLARRVPVPPNATRLLDLGGSHGLLGAAICRPHPAMRSTVIELAPAINHARALATHAGHADIVTHQAGDLLESELGTGWHVVLMANVLHHFTIGQVQDVLRRAHAALAPGGTVAIWELDRPAPGKRPAEGDAVALFFRLTSTAAAYSGEEYGGWLREVGFQQVRIVRPALRPGSVLVHARR